MLTAPNQNAPDDPYTRRLIYVRQTSLVESRCSRCGAVVVGSLTESLIEDENAHLRVCAKRRSAMPPALLK